MAALGRLLALEAALTKDMCFDYVFSDTSLDLQYFSINATVGADTVLMVMSLDKSDFEGTQRLMHYLYDLFKKKTGIIIQNPLFEYFSTEYTNNSIKLATHQLSIVGVAPYFCDILAAGGNGYSPPKNQIIRSQRAQ